MANLSPYSVVPNLDGTFVVVDKETGKILSTHLRHHKASHCAERLNKKDWGAPASLGRLNA